MQYPTPDQLRQHVH